MSKKVILEHNKENLYPVGIGPKQPCRWHTVLVDTVSDGKYTSTSDSGKDYSIFVVNGGTGIGLIDAPEVKVVKQKTQLRFLPSITGTNCFGVMNVSNIQNVFVRNLGDYCNTTSNTISPLQDVFTTTQSSVDTSVYFSNAAHHQVAHSVNNAGSIFHFTITWIKSTKEHSTSGYNYWTGYVRINGSMVTYGVDEEVQCTTLEGRTPIGYWRGANLTSLDHVHSSLEILETEE